MVDTDTKRRRQKARRRAVRQPATWLILALGVAAVALVAVALHRGHAPSNELVGSTSVPSTAPSASPVGLPGALFFGDSIVEGCCRQHGTDPTMAQIAAKALGWRPVVEGSGGTGYTLGTTVGGQYRPPYTSRLGVFAQHADAQFVIIEGGGNDGDHPDAARFRTALRRVLDAEHQALPHAKVVLVGPYSPGPRDIYAVQRGALKVEAAQRAIPFIDPTGEGWMAGHPGLLFSDHFHPNSAGQAYLGQRLTAALRRALQG